MYVVEVKLADGPISFRLLPSSTIPQPLLHVFLNPSPPVAEIHREVAVLRSAMRRLLSSRRLSTTRCDTFPFRHDVFRFLFKSCNVFCRTLPQFSLDRFPSDFFPQDWYVYTNGQSNAFYAQTIYLAPRLRKTKPTFAANPTNPQEIIPVPFSVLYTQVVSLKVVVVPCQ